MKGASYKRGEVSCRRSIMLRLNVGVPVARSALRRTVGCRQLATAAKQPNEHYECGIAPFQRTTEVLEKCPRDPCICNSGEHGRKVVSDPDTKWSKQQIKEAMDKNSLFTWGATGPMSTGAIQVSHGEGVYFWDTDGKKYLDFNSMAMCLQLGHSPPESVVKAVKEQLETSAYGYPGLFVHEVRAKLCKLLAEIAPGDINAFMFPSSGSEAMEGALRLARLYTGRQKVFARYRSYHGGTLGSMSVTGDQRRWPTDPYTNGVVHTFDPFPYSFTWGDNEEEVCHRSLTFLKEHLAYEGPKNVAAIVMESITGTNGVLIPPKGYLEGVRQICDENGILMICDEVMAGFGRTGKIFGFCNAPGVIPDVITFAKGVNGGFLPLGGLGVREHIAEHFRKNPIGYGSTYNSHPVALASAYASIRYILDNGLIPAAAEKGAVIRECLTDLMAKHPSIKQARNVGLFTCIDIQRNRKGDYIAAVTDPLPPAMIKFRDALYGGGVFTMMRGHNIFCNPPLIITPDQLREGFAVMDKALDILDEAMED